MGTTKVFPHVRHEFGGGSPVNIVLHLSKKLPVFDSEAPNAMLVEETEQGFYVLYGGNKAIFVARGTVEEVEFLSEKATPDQPGKRP